MGEGVGGANDGDDDDDDDDGGNGAARVANSAGAVAPAKAPPFGNGADIADGGAKNDTDAFTLGATWRRASRTSSSRATTASWAGKARAALDSATAGSAKATCSRAPALAMGMATKASQVALSTATLARARASQLAGGGAGGWPLTTDNARKTASLATPARINADDGSAPCSSKARALAAMPR